VNISAGLFSVQQSCYRQNLPVTKGSTYPEGEFQLGS